MRSKWFPLVIIIAMLVFGFAIYNQLPEQVPAHWDINGEVDRMQPRLMGVLFLPAMVLFIWAIRDAAPRLDPRRNMYPLFEGSRMLLLNIVMLFLGVIHVVSLGTVLGWEINIVQVVGASVGLLFMVFGNEMRRIQPNWFFGFRTPWTLSDPTVWRETHVLGGRLFFVVGLVTVVTAILTNPEVLVITIIAGAVLLTAGVFVYSYLRYRDLQGSAEV